jgi:tight adherence protein C
VGSVVAPVTGAAGALRHAARRPPSPSLDRRLAVAVASGATVTLLSPVGGPVGGAVAGVVVWVALRSRARAVVRRREHILADEAPDLAELFRIAVGAGLTVHLAVETVAPRRRGLSGAALAQVPLATSRGERLADALDRWAECGEPIRPLAAALAAAERYGEPLGPVLERVTADARLLRRRRAEEAARRLPVVLLFPLVCCVLPAFVLLAVAPLLLVALSELPH